MTASQPLQLQTWTDLCWTTGVDWPPGIHWLQREMWRGSGEAYHWPSGSQSLWEAYKRRIRLPNKHQRHLLRVHTCWCCGCRGCTGRRRG